MPFLFPHVQIHPPLLAHIIFLFLLLCLWSHCHTFTCTLWNQVRIPHSNMAEKDIFYILIRQRKKNRKNLLFSGLIIWCGRNMLKFVGLEFLLDRRRAADGRTGWWEVRHCIQYREARGASIKCVCRSSAVFCSFWRCFSRIPTRRSSQ